MPGLYTYGATSPGGDDMTGHDESPGTPDTNHDPLRVPLRLPHHQSDGKLSNRLSIGRAVSLGNRTVLAEGRVQTAECRLRRCTTSDRSWLEYPTDDI